MTYPQPQYPPASAAYYPAPQYPQIPPVLTHVEVIPGNGYIEPVVPPATDADRPGKNCAHCGSPVSATISQVAEETLSRVARVEEYASNMGNQLNWLCEQIGQLSQLTDFAKPMMESMAGGNGKRPNPMQLLRGMGGMIGQMQQAMRQQAAIESTTVEGAPDGDTESAG